MLCVPLSLSRPINTEALKLIYIGLHSSLKRPEDGLFETCWVKFCGRYCSEPINAHGIQLRYSHIRLSKVASVYVPHNHAPLWSTGLLKEFCFCQVLRILSAANCNWTEYRPIGHLNSIFINRKICISTSYSKSTYWDIQSVDVMNYFLENPGRKRIKYSHRW